MQDEDASYVVYTALFVQELEAKIGDSMLPEIYHLHHLFLCSIKNEFGIQFFRSWSRSRSNRENMRNQEILVSIGK